MPTSPASQFVSPAVRLRAFWPTKLDQSRPIIMADLVAPPVSLVRPLPPVTGVRGL